LKALFLYVCVSYNSCCIYLYQVIVSMVTHSFTCHRLAFCYSAVKHGFVRL